MKFVKSLFSENGDVSMTRVMALLSLLIGAVLALMGKDNVAVFVYSAFGSKVAQKIVETRVTETK